MKSLRWTSRTLAFIALLLFTACGGTNNMEPTPVPSGYDLRVSSVAVQRDSFGALEQVVVDFENAGPRDTDRTVPWNLMIDTTTPLDPARSTVIYVGAVNLASGDSTTLTLSASVIQAYGGFRWPSNGKYFFGATVDPQNSLDDDVLSNNTAEDETSWWVLNKSFARYLISGPMRSSGNLEQLPLGTYDVYVGLVDPANTFFPTSSSYGGPTPVATVVAPGFQKVSVTYFPGLGLLGHPSFASGVPYPANWNLVGFLDANRDGKIGFDASGHPTEPLATPNGPPTSALVPFAIADDFVVDSLTPLTF